MRSEAAHLGETLFDFAGIKTRLDENFQMNACKWVSLAR